MPNIIRPGYHGGAYQRPRNRVLLRLNIPLADEEVKAIRRGKRRCSCDGSQLTRLGKKCCEIAVQVNAQSWSIYPVPASMIGQPIVYVEFHNWAEMGMCNFRRPIGKKRYWWDVRAIEQWINPNDELAENDTSKDGNFDPDA